ncbi:3'-5' exonuclease [Caldalkalibacillus mannanilyticus]|uniref:3'-5' exonuclease n=1 Tax=Caldalkalibacillus mannanilyticus TaxID=1418 RepID=UPI000469F409|nr:3'-5' exonuclease [Caldalkalibacillus mannanilyticus]
MNAIVYDLELVKRYKKGQLSEIVEIGACKIDLKSQKITDQFQVYISPKSGYIGKSTRKFINMKKEDTKKIIPFAKAMKQFIEWIGADYFLCSWGKDDKIHLIDQCTRNKIKLDWFMNYNDIQHSIGKIIDKNNRNQLGLKTALALTGINPIGKAHRGIDDAINTGELLLKFIDQLELQYNQLSEKEKSHFTQKQKRSRSHSRNPNLLSKSNKKVKISKD